MADIKAASGHGIEIDQATGTATTGHSWDGIRELNTPLPRWWLWVFYLTQIWALGYIFLYPAIPLPSGGTEGYFKWHSRTAIIEERAEADKAFAAIRTKIRDLPLEDIVKDENLRRAAARAGESAFKVNCVQCHGADATGSRGYANLNDDDWLWGGTLADIQQTIQHGIRWTADDKTRISEMPAFGRDKVLDQTQVKNVAEFVMQLANRPHDAQAAAAGKQLFADNCAACHNDAGQGNREFGAPRLNDAVWLYGGTLQDVESQINQPHHGVMPAWGGRLDATTIKQLTVYVYSLGGGEKAEAKK